MLFLGILPSLLQEAPLFDIRYSLFQRPSHSSRSAPERPSQGSDDRVSISIIRLDIKTKGFPHRDLSSLLAPAEQSARTARLALAVDGQDEEVL